MTNKFIKFLKDNRMGLGAGAFVGLSVAAIYKFSGGDFMFAIADVQSRASGFSLSSSELLSLGYIATVLAWIIVGAVIGIILDWKFGFKFSQKTKQWLLIGSLALLAYLLFGNGGLGRAGLGREAGLWKTIVGGVGKLSGGWLVTLILLITGQVFGFFKNIFAPQPIIPIWIFFVAGFVLLLMIRKKGGGEQPIIIQR